jgi:hypothetical protein
VDINLFNDDEIVHPPEPDAPADRKVQAGDDVGDVGASSVESNALGPIGSGVPEKSKPFAVDWVLVVPPSGRCDRKHPPPATKWSNPIPLVDQVMTQVELPSYRGPHSPLDLVSNEFIFGRIIKAFQQISQVVAGGATSANDNKPLKKFHWHSLKKVLVLKYPCVLFHYLMSCCNSDVCYFAGDLMLTSHQKLLSRRWLMCWQQLLGLLFLLPLLWWEPV